jgi:acetylornithine deacetylase
VDELHQLLADLVAIDSVNPSLVPGGAGEAAIGRFVAAWLQAEGLEVHIEEVAPRRPNIVAVARGTGGGRSLLLNAHMDTVAHAGVERPLVPRIESGRMYGRGAYDMKAGLAAIMWAGAAAARSPRAGDVIVSGVCDEEFASIGAQALVRGWSADAAIVTEPTGEEVCLAVAHKGFSWHEIEVRGVAAHGSRPQDGVDAIARMGRVLVGVDQLAGELAARDPHPLLGHGSVHASLIDGGRELSTYPDRCLLQLERRTLPGETRESVEGELAAIIDAIVEDEPSFEAATRTTLVRPWLETSREEEIVRAMDAALGGGAEMIGVPYWADSAIIADAGIPTVICGPGGAGAHADVEWVDLAQLDRVAQALIDVSASFCG